MGEGDWEGPPIKLSCNVIREKGYAILVVESWSDDTGGNGDRDDGNEIW